MKRRSDRLRGSGRVGSVTTAGCSHSRQDAAGGTRAPRRRRQVDDDRLAFDAAFIVLVADGEARDAVVILAAGDDARLRDHGGGRSEITRDPVAEERITTDPRVGLNLALGVIALARCRWTRQQKG